MRDAGSACVARLRRAQRTKYIDDQTFSSLCGRDARKDIAVFDDFYRNEFLQVQQVCGFDPRATEAIREIKSMGYRVSLATNPLFPAIATYSRGR